MNLIQKYLTLGKAARSGRKFAGPVNTIIIHWVGPYPGQSVFAPWYWWEDGTNGEGVAASAHFIVRNGNVLQALPLDEVGWHSGDQRNYHSIGIEVIPYNEIGVFSGDSVNTLRELIDDIRKTHPKAVNIVRHYDGLQHKDCPKFYTPHGVGGDEAWERLLRELGEIHG